MDKILALFNNLYNEVINWITSVLFTLDGLYHVIGLVILMLIALSISSKIKSFINSFIKKENDDRINMVFIFLSAISFALIFFILASFAKIIYQRLSLDYVLIHFFINIFLAWIVIKAIFIFFRKSLFFRIFIVGCIIFIVLNTFNLLDDFSKMLDDVTFGVGNFKLSLLDLIKGLFTAFIAFWLAVRISSILETTLTQSKKVNPTVGVLLGKTFKVYI